MGKPGALELLLILFAIFLLFGANKLPSWPGPSVEALPS